MLENGKRPFGGKPVDLIGVPFDGMGRAHGQAEAPEALRAAGLEAAVGRGPTLLPDLAIPKPEPTRAKESGLLNEHALVEMTSSLHGSVAASLSAGHFPLVYGGDCSALLATVPALHYGVGASGLVFLDGHEDATPIEASADGEAANMEVALLAGFTQINAPDPLRAWLPALDPEAIAMVGPRDHHLRAAQGIPTVADRIWLRQSAEVEAGPDGTMEEAVRHVNSKTPAWWLHTDLDVLAATEFAACGTPGELLPGGITWNHLTTMVATALRSKGCRGWSVGVYNPDLDPDGIAATRIVEFVNDVTSE